MTSSRRDNMNGDCTPNTNVRPIDRARAAWLLLRWLSGDGRAGVDELLADAEAEPHGLASLVLALCDTCTVLSRVAEPAGQRELRSAAQHLVRRYRSDGAANRDDDREGMA